MELHLDLKGLSFKKNHTCILSKCIFILFCTFSRRSQCVISITEFLQGFTAVSFICCIKALLQPMFNNRLALRNAISSITFPAEQIRSIIHANCTLTNMDKSSCSQGREKTPERTATFSLSAQNGFAFFDFGRGEINTRKVTLSLPPLGALKFFFLFTKEKHKQKLEIANTLCFPLDQPSLGVILYIKQN